MQLSAALKAGDVALVELVIEVLVLKFLDTKETDADAEVDIEWRSFGPSIEKVFGSVQLMFLIDVFSWVGIEKTLVSVTETSASDTRVDIEG